MSDDDHRRLLERWAQLQGELDRVRAELARGVRKPPLPREAIDLLYCGEADERCALPLACVEEVVPIARLLPLPEAPAYVAGVLDLRGQLVPILDLVARLHGRLREHELDDSIIVCRVGERVVGLLVPGIPELRRAPHDRLREPPSDVPRAPYLWALLEDESASCAVLDVPSIVGFSFVPGDVRS